MHGLSVEPAQAHSWPSSTPLTQREDLRVQELLDSTTLQMFDLVQEIIRVQRVSLLAVVQGSQSGPTEWKPTYGPIVHHVDRGRDPGQTSTDRRTLLTVMGTSTGHPLQPGATIPLAEGSVSAFLLGHREPMLCADIAQSSWLLSSGGSYVTSSFLAIPLISANDVLGFLNLADRLDGQPFTIDDILRLGPITHGLAGTIRAMRALDRIHTLVERPLEVDDQPQTDLFIQDLSRLLRNTRRSNQCVSCIALDVDKTAYPHLQSRQRVFELVLGSLRHHTGCPVPTSSSQHCSPLIAIVTPQAQHAERLIRQVISDVEGAINHEMARSLRPLLFMGMATSLPGIRTRSLINLALQGLNQSHITSISPYVMHADMHQLLPSATRSTRSTFTSSQDDSSLDPVAPRSSLVSSVAHLAVLPDDTMAEHDRIPDEESIAMSQAWAAGIPFLAAPDEEMTPAAARLLPPLMALKYGCVPVTCEGNHVTIAMFRPPDPVLMAYLERQTRKTVTPLISSRSHINLAIKRLQTLAKADARQPHTTLPSEE